MTISIVRRAALLVLGVLALAPAARAAEPVYVQYACHLPDGTSARVDGFVSLVHGTATAENDCASGGGLVTTLPDGSAPSPTDARWTYSAPAGTSIVRITMKRTVRNVSSEGAQSPRLFYISDDNTFLDSCAYSTGCPETLDIDGADSGSYVAIGSVCNTDPCYGPTAGPAFVSADRFAITLRDSQPPVLTANPGGTLFAAEPLKGVRTVSVSATDVGGGVFTASPVVDGVEQEPRVLDTNGGACAPPFVLAVPCKKAADGTFEVDTTKIPDGQHTVRVVVRDATNVNSVSSPPVDISVRNGTGGQGAASPSPSELAAASLPRGAMRLLGRAFHARRLRQRWGRPTTLRGKLTNAEARPLPDVSLTVQAKTMVPGSRMITLGTVRTDSLGRFRFVIPAGTNRQIVVSAGDRRWTVKVEVPAPLRLRPSRRHLRNKQTLVLVADLGEATVAASSADVAFQVRIGRHWRTFATRPVGRNSRASIAHRFRVTYETLTYRFRAVVVGRNSFPYANGVSRPVAVRVN